MNIYYFIYFSVEFLKLYLFSTGILQLKVKKTVQPLAIISALIISIVAMFLDFTDYTGVFGAISIILMIIYAEDRKKRWLFPVLYIGISIFDILLSLILIPAMHITREMMENQVLISIGMNSVFLVLCILVIWYRKYKKKQPLVIETHRYIWLYLLAGCTVTFYLSCMQMNKLRGETDNKIYNHALYWSIGLSGIILFVICILFFIKNNQNEILQNEKQVNERLLKTQMEYYQMLLEKEKQTKAFRHDISNHVFCMQNLLEEKKYEELEKYLHHISEMTVSLSPNIKVGNTLISAIISDATEKFPKVSFEWKGMIPEQLALSSYDICTIFSNLIRNAFEAADKADEKRVSMGVREYKDTLVFQIENTYKQGLVIENGQYISTKSEQGHGFGLQNAREAIQRNNGTYQISTEKQRFVTEFTLPDILNQPARDER